MEIGFVFEERYGQGIKIVYPESYSNSPDQALERIPLPFLPCEEGWHWPEEARKHMLVARDDIRVSLDNSTQDLKVSVDFTKAFASKFYSDYKVYSIIEWHDLWVKGDDDCTKFVDQAIAANPKSVEDYKKGKENAIKHIMGQAMRFSKGKINPNDAMDMLKQKLG